MFSNKSSVIKSVAEMFIVIIIAVIVAIMINSFVLTTTRVHGKSMNATLYGGNGGGEVVENSFFNKVFFGKNDNPNYGDKVVILKTKKVKHGDIIVFKAINEQGLPVYDYQNATNQTQAQWIKRVIGVAGDEITIKNGLVYLNGNLLDEPYIDSQLSTYLPTENSLTVKIGKDEVFVMGDNRESSIDSRRVGCVSTENIVGRVVLVFGKKSQTIKTAKKVSNLQLLFT